MPTRQEGTKLATFFSILTVSALHIQFHGRNGGQQNWIERRHSLLKYENIVVIAFPRVSMQKTLLVKMPLWCLESEYELPISMPKIQNKNDFLTSYQSDINRLVFWTCKCQSIESLLEFPLFCFPFHSILSDFMLKIILPVQGAMLVI